MKFTLLILALAVMGANAGLFSIFSRNENQNYNFETMPNHKNFTLMARFIVHKVDWASVAYVSYEKDTFNLSLSTIFSTADGPISNGTGVPYFFLTEMEPAVKNLVRNDSRFGLMMSLAQTDLCQKQKWDPEDPRCARVFMTGNLKILSNNTAEYEFAKKSFSSRHPNFGKSGVPPFHKFFYAKYNIKGIKIISGFGGVRVIPLKDYMQVKDSKYNLMESHYE